MPVYYCPSCPLIFEYRGEVDHHLRTEHRSRAEDAELSAELKAAVKDLDEPALRALQADQSGLAVTLLLSTTPGPSMTNLDVARLRHLAARASRRLTLERSLSAPAVDHRLARAVSLAEGTPAQEGVAVLASVQNLAIVTLPFAPRDRAVVDPSFATRDLEAVLQCYPRYRVLVLGKRPRLLEGRGRHLVEPAVEPAEPAAPAPKGRHGGHRAPRPERWIARHAHLVAGCDLAERLLTLRVDAAGPLPLVVAGDHRWRRYFRQRSANAAAIVGEVDGSRHRASPQDLASLAEPHLVRRRAEAQAGALSELQRADAAGIIRWGLEPAWLAVARHAAEQLWVEDDLSLPGRPAGVAVERTNDPEEPGVVDDLVDDMIETAIKNGVAVHLLPAGSLSASEPLAVSLRAAELAAA